MCKGVGEEGERGEGRGFIWWRPPQGKLCFPYRCGSVNMAVGDAEG